MDIFELKKEQQKLVSKIVLRDAFTKIKTIGGAECLSLGDKLLASVVVCEYPSMKVLEHKTYLLFDPLPYRPEYEAYREMPALIEAYNLLEQEPDLLLVKGSGIAHPRGIGVASHLGLALNKSTIGISNKLSLGTVRGGKIIIGTNLVGFVIKTRKHSNPVYASPGHLVSLGTVLSVVQECIRYPHKLPEPLHLSHKLAKKGN